MKRILVLLTILTLTSCHFKSSADYNAEAEKLEQAGKFSEAIPLLDKAIEKDPSNIYALINRALDKAELEDYKGSIEDYTKVIEIDSDNALAFLNRGRNRIKLAEYEAAIDDFEKAIETKGGEIIYIDKVENPLIETGFEFDVAMEEIRLERGFARYSIDSLGLAFEDFNFCIQQNYEKPYSLYVRGIIYIMYGKKSEGCLDLIEAQKLGYQEAQEKINEFCR